MKRISSFFLLAALITLPGCASQSAPSAPTEKTTAAFANPQPVTVRGYDGDAMEPFISRDGKYLFFNNRNDPPDKTDLFYAKKMANDSFQFMGAVEGANSASLDAVASMDETGHFYFVSTRQYETTYCTLHTGVFHDGKVADVHLVEGVSRKKPGWVNMDAEISADGQSLYFANALFQGGGVPASSHLALAHKTGVAFILDANSEAIFKNVNDNDLEYAPSISSDGLELFFTRLTKPDKLRILRARRKSVTEPFGEPEVIAAIQGFVEAPSLSRDGKTLYYHRKVGNRFSLYKVSRIELRAT